MKPFAFHREADEEFMEALHHYADISPELGNRFYDEIHRLITEACNSPGTFASFANRRDDISPAISRTVSSTSSGLITFGFLP